MIMCYVIVFSVLKRNAHGKILQVVSPELNTIQQFAKSLSGNPCDLSVTIWRVPGFCIRRRPFESRCDFEDPEEDMVSSIFMPIWLCHVVPFSRCCFNKCRTRQIASRIVSFLPKMMYRPT